MGKRPPAESHDYVVISLGGSLKVFYFGTSALCKAYYVHFGLLGRGRRSLTAEGVSRAEAEGGPGGRHKPKRVRLPGGFIFGLLDSLGSHGHSAESSGNFFVSISVSDCSVTAFWCHDEVIVLVKKLSTPQILPVARWRNLRSRQLFCAMAIPVA